MYQVLIAVAALALATGSSYAAAPWTHCHAEGEDAASRHYYFFLDHGAQVERVRWVWNGGCCNPPEVTDYHLNLPGRPGTIQVRHLTGEREDVLTLITGGDALLTLVREHALTLARTAPKAPGLALDAQQSTDLYNLLNLLGGERHERPSGGCPTIEREPEPVDP